MAEDQRQNQGILTFWAVAEDEPMGKPLAECRRVPVQLSLVLSEELRVRPSQAELRQARIRRLTQDAVDQGGVLTLEELASILTSSYSTVIRDVTQLRRRGEVIPTRGQLKDIGRSIEGRLEIIHRYCEGESPERIAEITRRSLADVQRPIERFEEVSRLLERRMPVDRIAKITGVSSRLVQNYEGIKKQAVSDVE